VQGRVPGSVRAAATTRARAAGAAAGAGRRDDGPAGSSASSFRQIRGPALGSHVRGSLICGQATNEAATHVAAQAVAGTCCGWLCGVSAAGSSVPVPTLARRARFTSTEPPAAETQHKPTAAGHSSSCSRARRRRQQRAGSAQCARSAARSRGVAVVPMKRLTAGEGQLETCVSAPSPPPGRRCRLQVLKSQKAKEGARK
jgi:hypothetical protein